MDITHPLPLLAGLTPEQFMRRHWQKKPLLVRQALADCTDLPGRNELFKLAASEHVESRLITQTPTKKGPGWRLQQGPFSRRSLPSLSAADWTLLVQGLDTHHPAAHALLNQFRFIPDARLDDVMASFATPGGGVGPHFDSYDVFLLQGSGRKRWRISQQKDLCLQADMPLKILQNFQPEQEFVLEAGDMLYLPPCCAHEGVALADSSPCLTYSVGFRSPRSDELAEQLLTRLADYCGDELSNTLYRDPHQTATNTPAALPAGLLQFASQAVTRALADPHLLACALGEYLTEPKPNVWFEADHAAPLKKNRDIALDPRTRMAYDATHVFINGESLHASGKDSTLMQRLADQRQLSAAELKQLSAGAWDVLQDWYAAGWLC